MGQSARRTISRCSEQASNAQAETLNCTPSTRPTRERAVAPPALEGAVVPPSTCTATARPSKFFEFGLATDPRMTVSKPSKSSTSTARRHTKGRFHRAELTKRSPLTLGKCLTDRSCSAVTESALERATFTSKRTVDVRLLLEIFIRRITSQLRVRSWPAFSGLREMTSITWAYTFSRKFQGSKFPA